MKKLLFTGAILFGTFTFANTVNPQDLSIEPTVSKEISKGSIINTTNSLSKPRGYITIEFDINCGGQVGHMTVTYMSGDLGGYGGMIEAANAINQGTIQGCQQMANHGLI